MEEFCSIVPEIEDNDLYYKKEEKKFTLLKHENSQFSAHMDNDDILQVYLKRIGKIKLLKSQEEKTLAQRIAESDEKDAKIAKKKLIQANLRLVVNIAKRYVGRGVTFMDLIQEGSIGLMKAADMFDYKKGYKFSTYATWWIKQTILRTIANTSRTIRIPVYLNDKIRIITAAGKKLAAELNREPTDEELAKELKLSVKKIVSVKKAIIKEPMSLDMQIADDLFLEDYVPDESYKSPECKIQNLLLERDVESLLNGLNEREKLILSARYGINGDKPKTLEDIGNLMGFSKERIRQIQDIALKKIRAKQKYGHLRDYLN